MPRNYRLKWLRARRKLQTQKSQMQSLRTENQILQQDNNSLQKLLDGYIQYCGQINQCPHCHRWCIFETKRGSELFRDARYDAAERMYIRCPHCLHIVGSHLH